MEQTEFSLFILEMETVLKSGKDISEHGAQFKKRWKALNESNQVSFNSFRTKKGRLVTKSEIISLLEQFKLIECDLLWAALKGMIKDDKNNRCEIQHALGRFNRNKFSHYKAFNENAECVALILKYDKNLFKMPIVGDTIELDTVVCNKVIGAYAPDGSGRFLHLCKEFPYDGQVIPNTKIFGTGFFIAPDKVVTAAHVVEQASEQLSDGSDLIFIRGMYRYKHYFNGRPNILSIKKDSIYKLNQINILENRQTINGEGGDSAWLTVTPYFKDSGTKQSFKIPDRSRRLPPPSNVAKHQPVYAVGHGLGVAMKLSFCGRIEHPVSEGWMGCEFDIFPGNSGSPVFHANSHELLGIISGPDNLFRPVYKEKNCVSYQIDLSGAQSVQTSDIAPLINKMQKL
jgi:Trypsin-like peptidase domain